jgi:hypothetical protein
MNGLPFGSIDLPYLDIPQEGDRRLVDDYGNPIGPHDGNHFFPSEVEIQSGPQPVGDGWNAFYGNTDPNL